MNDYHRVKELFQTALALEPDQMAAYLDVTCEGDDSLRAEVESLIGSHAQAGGFIDAPAFEFAADLLAHAETESIEGKHIGPYRIIREIGRGGMGTVYLAVRDDDQYHKQVAIKLIKRGMDTDFVVQRFRNERQILANLDHPNIARLLEGGATGDGLPYFVMEYIEGKRIDEYCDANGLSNLDRLKLFRQVCSAIHYAHQNLIIHRDIKPSNILITSDGTPKLLDFGIAKLLDPAQSMHTNDHTATELRLMTPDYASPEQVKGEGITTVSDVYSLGVLLYELLTGRRPYRISKRAPSEIVQVICGHEPDKPSAAAISELENSKTQEGPASQFAVRNPKGLRGDLDNIVLMALRKDPQRRYSSVEQFSEDIRRHLEDLPVIARKDTLPYRTAKLIERNKVAAAATAVFCVMLVAGISVIAWEARVASRQSKVAAEQRDTARVETAKAERINKFLQDMLASANVRWYASGRGGKGEETRVVDVLNQAAQRLETELNDQPEVKAELYRTIGTTYLGIDRNDLAVPQFRASLKLYRELYGEKNLKVAEALYFIASASCAMDHWDAAEPAYREALEIQRALPGGNNAYLPHILREYSAVLSHKGDDVEAEALLLESIELFRNQYGDDHVTVAAAYGELPLIYLHRGELDRAESAARQFLDILNRSPEASPADKINALLQLSGILMHERKYQEGDRLLEQSIALHGTDTDHNDERYSRILCARAWLSSYKHDYARAEAQAREAVAVARRSASGVTPQSIVSGSLQTLGEVLIDAGQPARGEIYLRESLAILSKISFGDSARVADTLGESLSKQKRYREAEPLLIKGYNELKSNHREQDPTTIKARQRLVELYEAWGKRDLAARYRLSQ
jgi:serine/threonine protein kinase